MTLDALSGEESGGLFGVRLRGREDLLGFCGFVRLEGMEEPELWYALTHKAWGRGLATEAAQACTTPSRRWAWSALSPVPTHPTEPRCG